MERHNGLEPDPEGAFVYHDDAQATIAALQTRVKELEQIAISHDQSMRYITGQAKRTHEKLTTVQATLTQRTAECDALKLVNETHMKTVMKLSHIVEQQTAELEAVRVDNRTYINERHENMKQIEQLQADLEQRMEELEAAKADKAKWEEIAGLRFAGDHKFVKEMELLKVENATLQAELERVRDQYADLSKLIKALPKVEGEITATRIPCSAAIGEWWYVGWIRFPNERTAQSYVDLLKHRQGMEG